MRSIAFAALQYHAIVLTNLTEKGGAVPLTNYKGKVVLVFNGASK